ncbi:hypothetical protein AYI68_g3211 [Smittium mucronatum]|uniref:Uncharacterized protein n=1 Tax=Smittium mucronatum TaxID=133383 RepID=A0A1R0H0J4_9FUNG|nr:hypothetical protein AYI68_g3211 [Smittium mucronatum]
MPKLSAPLLVHLSHSSSRELSAGKTPLLRLSTLFPLQFVLTTLSVCTAPMVGIIGENLTCGSFISASPAKLIDGSKSSHSAKTSEEEDTEVSLALSSATSHQASTSGANPKG